MTDPGERGDQEGMHATARRPVVAMPAGAIAHDLASVYEQHFDFVWRSARRLGVPESAVDDVVQEVFLVVHRQLASFEGRSSMKTWLFGILHNLVLRERRTWARRERPHAIEPVEPEPAPDQQLAEQQARRLLHALLAELDDDKRAVFVLYELEQLSMAEIAEATGCPVQTAYSRLHAARRLVEASLAQAQQKRKLTPCR